MKNDTYHQPMLFESVENNTLHNCNKYQIRCIDNPSFGLTINIDENEDPEIVALERLGYFVIPETTIY